MVSTEKCYATDNSPILTASRNRGEYLYRVRVYMERARFLSPQAGNTRLRVLLGFIESRTAVIDATIRHDGLLHYLSVLCSSRAPAPVFSAIMKKTAPRAIVEEVSPREFSDSLTGTAMYTGSWGVIPYALPVTMVQESRNILISLLLEYRALTAELRHIGDGMSVPSGTVQEGRNTSLKTSFLIFEKDSRILAIPEFHIERVSSGANGSSILHISKTAGQRLFIADDLLMVRDFEVLTASVGQKVEKGIYNVHFASPDYQEALCLVIPSFL